MREQLRYQCQQEIPYGSKVTVHANGTIRMGVVCGCGGANFGIQVRYTGGNRRRIHQPTDLEPRGRKARRRLKKLRAAP